MTEKFIPIEDVADHFSVSISTVRVWITKGIIPESAYIKLGYVYRFKLNEVVEALIDANKEENGETQNG
jgi:predicted site-specific integrase-resolvase